MRPLTAILGLPIALLAVAAQPLNANAYRSFSAAVYIPVEVVRSFQQPGVLQAEWDRLSSQLPIDKVYIESYRDRQVADEALLESVKAFFVSRGVRVAGGMALSDTEWGQFRSFCYTDPRVRAYVARVSALTARHFDEIILDDFFFNNTKTDSDIAAKGTRSWTEFRLALMDDVAANLVVGPAKAANPRVRVVVKYPNWYEYYQGNGYDLDREPHIFAGIYTGTESRDPVLTDQNLQPYQSYETFRFLQNVSPGRNGGGWIDTYSLRCVDEYAEQLWDTLLAKAPEITLFNWADLLRPAAPGSRPWAGGGESFDYVRFLASLRNSAGRNAGAPSMAAVAGYALDRIDPIVGRLGKPVGIASYKPLQSVGEDYLHNFLGMVGLPIELRPSFPDDVPVVLLTESAACDPAIVAKIKAHLAAGQSIIVTSGLVRSLQARGFGDIAEIRYTGRKVALGEGFGAFGPGNGADLGRAPVAPPILIPELRFVTNDAWPLVRSVAGDEGYPLLLMDRYSRGTLLVLTVPDNFGDLYRYPPGILDELRRYVSASLFARFEGPAKIALFEYDNRTFVVQSFLDAPSQAVVALSGEASAVRDLTTGEVIKPEAQPPRDRRWPVIDPRTRFTLRLPPHSYRAFAVEGR